MNPPVADQRTLGDQPEESLTTPTTPTTPKFHHQSFEQSPLIGVSHPKYSSTNLKGRLLPPTTQDLPPSPNKFHRRFFMGSPKFVYHTFPNTPVRSLSPTATPSLIDVTSEEPQPPEDDEWGNDRPHLAITPPTSTKCQSYIRRMKNTILKILKKFHKFMTIPLYAALASFAVALIPPVQHFMMEHVAPVRGFLTSAGACSIPITMIVLGAYFYQPPSPDIPPEAPESPTVTIHTDMDEEPLIASREEDADPEQQAFETSRVTRSMMNTSQISVITLAESVKSVLKMRSLRRRMKGGGKMRVESASKRPGETTTVIVACLARMIVTPMIILPAMGALALHDVHPLFEE